MSCKSLDCRDAWQIIHQQKQIMNTSPHTTLESLKIQAGYAEISDFFSAYSLAQARKYLQKILKASNANRSSGMNPSAILYFFERLQQLYAASMLIHQSGLQRDAAIITSPDDNAPDLANYPQYCGWNFRRSPWYYTPRSLSEKEYFNPYKVFKKLEAYASEETWKFIFHELRDYTFLKGSFSDAGDNYNILDIYILLNKLLEACHLIEVRAIIELDGRPRPKWKNDEMQKAALETTNENRGLEEKLNSDWNHKETQSHTQYIQA
jgi:hypothetical protein